MPQTALSKRGSTYYLRLRVPVDLVSHYGRVEFKLSLKTRDRSIAIRQVRAELARLEREFSDLRERELRERTVQTLTRQRVTSLDEAMLDAIASSWLEQNLASDDLLRASGDAGDLTESIEATLALLRPAYANA